MLKVAELKGTSERKETPLAMSICSREKVLMIQMNDSDRLASSILVYDIDFLRRKAVLDVSDLEKKLFSPTVFLKYCGNKAYFTGQSCYESGSCSSLYTFSYDTESNVIREEESLRKKDITDSTITKFFRKEDGLIVGLSHLNNLLTIKFE